MEQLKDLLCNERVMLYAIMVNTALMFFGGFWPASPWFEWTDALFTLIFLFLGLSEAWAPIPVYCICIPVNFLLVRFVFNRL